MCPPTEYKIAWEINPWMSTKNQPDSYKAWYQWHRIFEIYQKLRIKIYLIKPVPELTDMIFTANSGWGRKGTFILSNFRYPERRPEREHFKSWFRMHGFKTITLPKNVYFEGQGDMVTLREAYLFGWGQRSSIESKDIIKKSLKLQKEIIPLRLINPKFYHLDTCLMYLAPINTIMYYPGAFDRESLKRIKKLEADKIEVNRKEAESFLLNGIYHEDTIVLCGESSRVASFLKKKGLEVITVDTSEFKKSGAGVRCLTLFLD